MKPTQSPTTAPEASLPRLAGRIAMLVAALLAINLLVRVLLPYPWGDARLVAKLDHLTAHGDEYDTVFVGSSYTYRQVSPKAFDLEIQRLSGGAQTSRSFNLAMDGTHLPASLRLAEHLADQDLPRLKTVILELGHFISAVDEDIDHATEGNFWRTPRLTLSMMRFLWQRPDKSTAAKLYQTARLAGIQLEASLHIGQATDVFEYVTGQASVTGARALGPDMDGFYAVDRQALDLTGEPLKNRFLSNPNAIKILESLEQTCRKAFETELRPVNQEGAAVLSALVSLADSEGWELIFVVPPRMGDRYYNLRPLFQQIPETQLIDEIADPRQHDSLFLLDESTDPGHFNEKGALRYTRLLAEHVFERRASDEPVASNPPATPVSREADLPRGGAPGGEP